LPFFKININIVKVLCYNKRKKGEKMKINAYEYRSALKDKEAPSFITLGITADIIMSKEILKNTTEIAEFIENIFKIGAPLSEMRSEIVAEILEKISVADQKTRNGYRVKLLNFVEEKFYSKEKNNKKTENNLSKWIKKGHTF
jgi:hypothetical protein